MPTSGRCSSVGATYAGPSPTAADDLVAGLGEQQLEPLAQQHRVVRDDDPHRTGSQRDRAVSTVGPPVGRADLERAVDRRPAAAASPARPLALARVGAADAVVLDPHLDRAARRPTTATDARVGAAVLGDVGERLGDHEVDGGLDVRRQRRRARRSRDSTGTSLRTISSPERRGEAAVDQQRRGDAARERAQLVDGLAGLDAARASMVSAARSGSSVELALRPGRGPW